MNKVREVVGAVLDGTVDYETGLDALILTPSTELDPVLTAALFDACAARWRAGWQPVELHRIVTRRGRPRHALLIVDAVAEHLRRFAPSRVDERWRAQAETLEAVVWWPGATPTLDRIAARWRCDRVDVVDAILSLLAVLSTLPPIEVLMAPPGEATPRSRGQDRDPRRRVDERLLDRVRALLAKAESTPYPPEAQAYTAKAQQLAARHSIDTALLNARTGAPVVPFARRIGVDHPYEGEKAGLLDAVARSNRCHAVCSPELGFVTVFGFDVDIDAVDLLYTSLLVQAGRAMALAEPPGGKAGRSRLRTFRQSFLVAFAVRIGERLTAAADAAMADAATDPGGTVPPAGDRAGAAPVDLLPVLHGRDEQVRESMRRAFPRTVQARGSRVDSHEGWHSGRAAADAAALTAPQT